MSALKFWALVVLCMGLSWGVAIYTVRNERRPQIDPRSPVMDLKIEIAGNAKVRKGELLRVRSSFDKVRSDCGDATTGWWAISSDGTEVQLTVPSASIRPDGIDQEHVRGLAIQLDPGRWEVYWLGIYQCPGPYTPRVFSNRAPFEVIP